MWGIIVFYGFIVGWWRLCNEFCFLRKLHENLTFSFASPKEKVSKKKRRLFSNGSAAKKIALRCWRTTLLSMVALLFLPIPYSY
jgi:hypothetical protein